VCVYVCVCVCGSFISDTIKKIKFFGKGKTIFQLNKELLTTQIVSQQNQTLYFMIKFHFSLFVLYLFEFL